MKLLTVSALIIGMPQIICLDNCKRFCNSTPHTECYPMGGGNDCKNNEKVYLSTDEKRAILDFHNDKRSKVGSDFGPKLKCSNMMKLVWNGEMGMLAKRWADQCKEGEHDTCRPARDNTPTGQNSYIGRFKKTRTIQEQRVKERYERIVMMLQTWFNEIDSVEETDIRKFDENRTAVIGNATQMIWADTIYVGCGYTEFTLANDFLMYRFICDYKPSGNIPSKAVYEVGTPCSKCPKGSKCSENFNTICFNGVKNDFIDDSKAQISKPAFYTIAIFFFIALLRVFRCAVDW